jgi:hypothetical protein
MEYGLCHKTAMLLLDTRICCGFCCSSKKCLGMGYTVVEREKADSFASLRNDKRGYGMTNKKMLRNDKQEEATE